MIMKMHSLQKILLDHEDSISGRSLVSFCNDFEEPLQNTEKFKFLRENIYLPSLDFCTGNPYSKMFLTRTFLFVNRISKFLLHIWRQTRCLIVPRKYFIYI